MSLKDKILKSLPSMKLSEEDIAKIMALKGGKASSFDKGNEESFEAYAKKIDAEEAGRKHKKPVVVIEKKEIVHPLSDESEKDEGPKGFDTSKKRGRILTSDDEIRKYSEYDKTPEAGIEDAGVMGGLMDAIMMVAGAKGLGKANEVMPFMKMSGKDMPKGLKAGKAEAPIASKALPGKLSSKLLNEPGKIDYTVASKAERKGSEPIIVAKEEVLKLPPGKTLAKKKFSEKLIEKYMSAVKQGNIPLSKSLMAQIKSL